MCISHPPPDNKYRTGTQKPIHLPHTHRRCGATVHPSYTQSHSHDTDRQTDRRAARPGGRSARTVKNAFWPLEIVTHISTQLCAHLLPPTPPLNSLATVEPCCKGKHLKEPSPLALLTTHHTALPIPHTSPTQQRIIQPFGSRFTTGSTCSRPNGRTRRGSRRCSFGGHDSSCRCMAVPPPPRTCARSSCRTC